MKTQEEMRKEDQEYYKNHAFYETYEKIRERDAETLRKKGEQNGK